MKTIAIVRCLTLVDVGLGLVGLLVLLVDNGILGSGGAAGEAGIVVLGDTLVGFLGGSGSTALDGLGNVVGGVLKEQICQLLMVKIPGWINKP
jgi:hypothetical protein